jgi:hypothetical protein
MAESTLLYWILILEWSLQSLVVISSLFLRWHGTFSVVVWLLAPAVSTTAGMIWLYHSRTLFEQRLELFFFIISIASLLLGVIQLSSVLVFQGSVPSDPSLIADIIYQDEFHLLIAMLIVFSFLSLLELVRIWWRYGPKPTVVTHHSRTRR